MPLTHLHYRAALTLTPWREATVWRKVPGPGWGVWMIEHAVRAWRGEVDRPSLRAAQAVARSWITGAAAPKDAHVLKEQRQPPDGPPRMHDPRQLTLWRG